MLGSIRLGTILGIPVGVNWSVLLVAWLIAFSLAGQILPAQVPGLDSAFYWVAGAVVAVLFFGSLLAHELSHALVARREGLAVLGITLWLLGGVARMEGDARSPGAEARIAGVGPLTSLGLAALFGAVAVALAFAPASDVTALAFASAAWLSFVNLVLALFNLLPGAPLDGGRIVRALVWRLRGDRLQATRWATSLGRLLGYGLAIIGLWRVLSADLGGLWFVLLGFFLATAAGAERRSAELFESLRGVLVGDIMERAPLRVPASLTVDTFVDAAVREDRSPAWLLTGPGGVVTAVLGLEQLRAVRGEERRHKRLFELATPLDHSPVAFVDEPVLEVLTRLEGQPVRVVVRDRTSSSTDVLGLLTSEDISRTIDLGRLRDGRTTSADGEASAGPVLP
jgi:Zn-dependent protease